MANQATQKSEESLLPPQIMTALSVPKPPKQVLQEAREAARALAQVLKSKPQIKFNDKIYLQSEDWLTIARFYGVTARIASTHYVTFGEEGDYQIRGFEARAEAYLVSTDQIISTAESMCLNDETNWGRKPLFQLRAMAQTRAISRVLAQVFRWVAVMAGYAGTPSEEMGNEEHGQSNNGIQRTQRVPNSEAASMAAGPDWSNGTFLNTKPARAAR